MRRSPLGPLLAVLALVAGTRSDPVARADDGSPVPAASESPVGPELGNLTYRAHVEHGPDGSDTDSYCGPLAAGERVTVSVVSPFQSGLLPRLEFLGPGGETESVRVVARNVGKSLSVRDWVVPRTGRWTVRVSGVLDTWGKYSVSFRIRPPAPFRAEIEPDEAGAVPADALLAFEALAGSALDLRASVRSGPAPRLEYLHDPAGADVAGADGPAAKEAVTRGKSLRLRLVGLGADDGTYVARITAPAGHEGLVATARVTAPRRPSGTRRLAKEEPWVEPRPTPIRSVTEIAVRIAGRHFAIAPRPVVLFGDEPGTDVLVDPFGTEITVRPPVLPEGATVRVAVVNPDGQAGERAGYFHYVPAPAATDLVDEDGVPVRGSSTLGGRRVRILGANFETGVFVRFGQSPDVIPILRSGDVMELTVPPQPAGPAEVRVLDAYLHDVLVPVEFEYKAPPEFDEAPYAPDDPAGTGFSLVSVSGSGFVPGDVVLFDGEPAPTTFIAPFQLWFLVPASTPGPHEVAVRDRVGTVVEGPALVVR